MNLEEYRLKIINGQVCPYCNSDVRIASELEVYGREYRGRKIHVCVKFPSCDSYVGSHDDGTPLGRLANKELREWKELTHSHFDPIWKEEYVSREELYIQLSNHLGRERKETHIGMFDVKDCRSTIKWAANLYNSFKEKNYGNDRK